MKEFYRNPSALGEEFILKNLNKEIKEAIETDIIKHLEKGTVLDIGCGEQPLKKHFVEKGFVYKGLDYKQNDTNTVDFIAFIDEPLNISETFDVIVCTEVLEHVFDWGIAFKNIETLCNDNALILITCPMFYPLHEAPYDYWRPTPFAIKRIAEKYGLSVVKEKKVGNGLDVLATTLSYSYFYPADNSIKNRLLAKIAVRLRSLILNNIKKEEAPLTMESPFFMSNLFLLKKSSKY